MEEMAGWENTHQEIFARKMMVKIRMLRMEKRSTFGTRLADGCIVAGTGEKKEAERIPRVLS